MRKNDRSIYNIVVASINRHSMDIETWEKTKLWNVGEQKIKDLILSKIIVESHEILILYIWINQDNWTIFTTRAVYFSKEKIIKKIELENIKNYDFDVARFKGISGNQIDFLKITDIQDVIYRVPYETGKPSMAAIYGIQTLIQIS